VRAIRSLLVVRAIRSLSVVRAIRSLSVVRAIRSLSVVRAIKESLGSKHLPINQEVLAGSIGQASKEAQRTDAGNSIITDQQRTLRPVPSPGIQLRPEGLVTKGGRNNREIDCMRISHVSRYHG
jgi:hypothetical protein